MASSLKTVFPCFALVFFLFSLSEAREFLVGGKGGSWKIPSYPDEYNKWAEKNRFQIGDYLGKYAFPSYPTYSKNFSIPISPILFVHFLACFQSDHVYMSKSFVACFSIAVRKLPFFFCFHQFSSSIFYGFSC